MSYKNILIVAFASSVSGCAITQTVTPVAKFENKEICVVVNPAVMQPAFVETYQRLLTGKGYDVRALPPASSVASCPVTSTYTANWRWDLALYMAYADIQVFADGKLSGQAVYDSRRGGANMSKFIKAEEKLSELVDQLFPNKR